MRKYLVLSLLFLAACDTELVTEISRDQARDVVDGVIAEKYPGVDATAVTDCIIDSASGSEIVEIAAAAITGVTEETVVLVLDISTRPETAVCIVAGADPMVAARVINGL